MFCFILWTTLIQKFQEINMKKIILIAASMISVTIAQSENDHKKCKPFNFLIGKWEDNNILPACLWEEPEWYNCNRWVQTVFKRRNWRETGGIEGKGKFLTI